jgi:DNA-binding MarR family transcriptional regulator
VCVHLTAAGREALRAKEEVVARKRQTLYDWLSPVERRLATELFRRLADELDVL